MDGARKMSYPGGMVGPTQNRSYVDLEVDLVRRADGTVPVVDADEFRALEGLPPGHVRAVEEETTQIRELLADPAAVVMREGWLRLGRGRIPFTRSD